MSYTIDIQADQPVVTITYHGTVDARELAEAQQAMLSAGKKIDARCVYCILDVRDSHVSFVDGMVNLKEFMYTQRKNRSGGIQVAVIFVGMNPIVKAFMQAMQMAPMGRYRVFAAKDIDGAMNLVKHETAR